MKRSLAVSTPLAVLLALLPGASQPVPARGEGACQFVLGFAALRALLPVQVGDCLEEQQTNVANGDAYQRTTGGLLVWRKADNWTAFTDGYRTWINGPRGLQQRLNVERYAWEGDAGAAGTTLIPDTPLAPPAPAPPAAPPTVAPPPAAPAPLAPTDRCGAPPNPWGYTFCRGTTIAAAPRNFCSYFACIPSFWQSTNGYVAQCVDGMYSHSGGVRGACSSHGGVARPLLAP